MDRRSRRNQGLSPEHSLLPPRTRKVNINGQNWSRHEKTVTSDKSRLEDEMSTSSSLNLDNKSKHGSSSWLINLPSHKSSYSVRSTVSQRRKQLELKSKLLEERQNAEAEFAKAELKRKLDRLELQAELEMARMEDEESKSQYLGSDDDDDGTNSYATLSDFGDKCKIMLKAEDKSEEPIKLAQPKSTYDDARRNARQSSAIKRDVCTPTCFSAPNGKMRQQFNAEPIDKNTKYSQDSHAKVQDEVKNENSQMSTQKMVPFSADQLSLLFQAQDIAKHQPQAEHDTGGGDIKKFVARQSGVTALPDFSGEPEKWPMYINHYLETTKECGYSDFNNICRLRKSLKGKALAAVEEMLNHTDKLPLILKCLQDNFGQPELIIKTLILKTKKLPQFKEDKPDSVIEFSHAVSNLVATMESLKKENYMNNPTLMEDLVEKLPVTFKTKWGNALAKKTDDVTLKDFAEWMEKRATAARLLKNSVPLETFPQQSRCKVDDEHRVSKDFGKRKSQKKDVVATTTESAEEKSSDENKCLFCSKKNHKTHECRSFAKQDVASRWKWATENKVCFACLKDNHTMSNCKEKTKCEVDGCQMSHHKLLHNPKSLEKKEENCETVTIATEEKWKTTTTLRRVMPVILKGPKAEIQVIAMLDSGSTVTLLDAKIAERLGLQGPKKGLHMTLADGKTVTETNSKILSVNIRGVKEKDSFTMENVRTVRELKLPPQSVDMKELTGKWNHLRQLPINSLEKAIPKVLIGDDQCHLIVTRDIREGPRCAPIASHNKLGWVVHGPEKETTTDLSKESVSFICHVDEQLCQLVKDSFSTESFGVKVVDKLPQSWDITSAERQIAQKTRRVGERWETGLLWAREDIRLPSSKKNALNRLTTLRKKMERDPELARWYHEKIDYYIAAGYARKLSLSEAREIGPKTWYLPHFAAEHPNKVGKRRLVFDAAAKCHGESLNDNLLSGPDLLTALPGVLIRFRVPQIGCSGDIREMFPQVLVCKEDQCAQRFLWTELGKEEPDTYEMQVMTFGATCSPCLAQVVKNGNAMEFADEFPRAAEAIIRKHYVDDYLDGADSEAEVLQLIKDVREVHRRGGFEIRSWNCSSLNVLKALQEEIPGNERPEKDLNLEGEMSTEKVLGLRWNPNHDYFFFSRQFNRVDPTVVSGERRPTKREVLKTFMSLFDPLGFAVHFTVKARILFQQVWRSGINWDDEITDVQFVKWRTWLLEMKNIVNMKIPRCYSKLLVNFDSIQLHIFCDSSEEAFAAVAYLRIQKDENTDTTLVMARARVAPLKPMTIPRLELQAALMGSRLATTLKMELDLEINETHFWSDSKTVISWIRSDARQYKPFVACRVGEILESTSTENWHWVSTGDNVADEATRSSSDSDFSSDSRWLKGPAFLRQPPEQWPMEGNSKEKGENGSESDDDKSTNEEMKPEFVFAVAEGVSCLPDLKILNSWSRLLRSTAWILRFLNKFKKDPKKITGELTPRELLAAEKCVLRQCQSDSFEKIESLKQKKEIQKLRKLRGLCPVLCEDGLLRAKGRVRNSPELAESTQQPIILEPKHPITRLLVMHYHWKAGHSGQEYVLNELRQKYWIIDARNAVRSAWNRCNFCRVARAKPEFPEMAPLPAVRLTRPPRAFTFVGVDYFGPLSVTVNRHHEKRYGVLFTCLSVRAVHLEIASSLSTDSFIMALRRFIGRRGCPDKIYSDNGTNFHGANNELKLSLLDFDQEEIIEKLAAKGIEWHFIPPSAPHMGGTWERLVKSVKKALSANLKEQSPKEETLHTLFVEAENIVNSRPLTRVSADINDSESLTPNHFLIGSSAGAPNMGVHPREDLFSRKQWRIGQVYADQFWKRWIREYLPSLTRRTKWHKPSKPIKVGDLVFIADGDLPRNTWPRGIITEVTPGKDGIIRVVKVKTASGELKRPVVKICVLDVNPEVSSMENCGDEDSEVDKPEDLPLGGVCATKEKG